MDNFIGSKIREARELISFSREQVGRKLGVSQQQIARYESGENKISADKLAIVSIILRQPIDYFYP